MAKLIKIINQRRIMKVKTGLRIAGGNEEIRIGGIDNPIVKDPLTGLPYMPGSSLKGCLRYMLEIALGKTEVCSCGDDNCIVCKLFGRGVKKKDEEKGGSIHSSRLIVRDSFLTEKSRMILTEVLPLGVELKSENTINRITGTAQNPRTFDRVPAGVEFEVNTVLKIYEGDDEKRLLEALSLAFKLVELNYIGSSGSRGYGKVEFSEPESETYDISKEIEKLQEKGVIK